MTVFIELFGDTLKSLNIMKREGMELILLHLFPHCPSTSFFSPWGEERILMGEFLPSTEAFTWMCHIWWVFVEAKHISSLQDHSPERKWLSLYVLILLSILDKMINTDTRSQQVDLLISVLLVALFSPSCVFLDDQAELEIKKKILLCFWQDGTN